MLTLIKNSAETSLDDGTLCFKIGDDGWGMVPVNRLAQAGPQQHGETDYGFRLLPRVGNLILQIPGTSLSDLYDKRHVLLELFSPYDLISFRWDNLDRQIDGYFIGQLTMPANQRQGFHQVVAVSIRCPDPSFYDPELFLVAFGLGGGAESFVVPMPVPHGVGSSALDETVGIDYTGSWQEHPIIRITGPIANPVITNITTNEKLDFTGTTIPGGDYYDIDTRYGFKTVIEDDGTNRIDKLTSDSDLATFHLQPDSAEVPGGSNSIRVEGSSVTEATKVELWYYRRYLGI